MPDKPNHRSNTILPVQYQCVPVVIRRNGTIHHCPTTIALLQRIKWFWQVVGIKVSGCQAKGITHSSSLSVDQHSKCNSQRIRNRSWLTIFKNEGTKEKKKKKNKVPFSDHQRIKPSSKGYEINPPPLPPLSRSLSCCAWEWRWSPVLPLKPLPRQRKSPTWSLPRIRQQEQRQLERRSTASEDCLTLAMDSTTDSIRTAGVLLQWSWRSQCITRWGFQSMCQWRNMCQCSLTARCLWWWRNTSQFTLTGQFRTRCECPWKFQSCTRCPTQWLCPSHTRCMSTIPLSLRSPCRIWSPRIPLDSAVDIILAMDGLVIMDSEDCPSRTRTSRCTIKGWFVKGSSNRGLW